ncbi:MAG TPA: HisA/HisF-related TIM barrel protein [Vicinamibacteria bacterium]|nr:HisA/HisF-related TIM barrel protein [Vicinamibacteria bacterium]
MRLIPAVDLRRGRVVRLRQGRDGSEEIYDLTPVEAARSWESQGASWLHVVDLDAAFGEGRQREPVAAIVKAVDIPVQLGGGVRSDEDFVELDGIGVSRIIFGTAAVERPDVVERALSRAADKVVIGVDVKGGRLAVRGWKQMVSDDPDAFGRKWRDRGVHRFVFTDVSRDGDLSGVNLEATAAFARATDGGVVASGGVGTLEHLSAVRGLPGIEGVIVGRALYQGAFSFDEAQSILAGPVEKL